MTSAPALADLPEVDWPHLSDSDLLERAIAAAPRLAERLPLPAAGQTPQLWRSLSELGALDLTLARIVEPHLDATAILAQAGLDSSDLADGLFGVFAAEGPGARLTATEGEGGTWRLSGSKPWCSLADRVTSALVTAWVSDRARRLFLVEGLQSDTSGYRIEPTPWVPRGLRLVQSPTVTFDERAATPVGDVGWYLTRPGFAWGGVGVAAIWLGGAIGVARRLWQASEHREPDQIALMHLGAVDTAIAGARALLDQVGDEADDGAEGGHAATLASRARQSVHRVAEEVLWRADHGLGPGPLTADEAHARRVADLRVYLRQDHAEHDQVALGTRLRAAGTCPW